MKLKRITDSTTADFEALYAIYTRSFPIFEQRILSDHIQALNDKEYFCHAVKDAQNTVVGLLCTWRTDSFIYVEHLAILESERRKNIGTNLLKQLIETSDVPIILEIDPPVDDISIRRKGFYEKLGFIVNDFVHIHPAFTEKSGSYELKVLSIPSISAETYATFRRYLDDRIMYYSASRKP